MRTCILGLNTGVFRPVRTYRFVADPPSGIRPVGGLIGRQSAPMASARDPPLLAPAPDLPLAHNTSPHYQN